MDQEAEQHNLVLNQTYDSLIASYGFTLLTQYAAVGTGSTPPAATQTGLVAEARRTNRDQNGSTGTFSYTRVANGVYEQTTVREFLETEVGNSNLTEWGFSPSNTAGGNLICRELFRDGNGNPIVITPAADQRLRLIYKTRVTLSPTVAVSASIDISGIGVRTGKYVLTLSRGGTTSGSYPDLVVVELAITGSLIDSGGGTSTWYQSIYLHSVALPTTYTDTTENSSVLVYKWPGLQAYVSGSRQRKTNPVTFALNEANGTIRTIGLGPRWGGGFRFVLDSGQEFTKDSLYKLTINEFTVTWGP
ncbi:hypothetical protein ACKLNZ_10050 [Thermus scotoductus]